MASPSEVARGSGTPKTHAMHNVLHGSAQCLIELPVAVYATMEKLLFKANIFGGPSMMRTEEPFEALFHDEKEGGAERLIMLSDGIFAIAMTLLVLDIKLPDELIQQERTTSHGIDPRLFQQYLPALFWLIVFYGLTFFVIANYWRSHRRLMHLVERVDSRFISLTLLFLGLIALFPAAMSLQSTFGGHAAQATIIYILVLAACGFSMHALWAYAIWNHRLVNIDIDRTKLIFRSITQLVFPVYICLTLLLFFVPAIWGNPPFVFLAWAALPLLGRLVRFLYERQMKRTQKAYPGKADTLKPDKEAHPLLQVEADPQGNRQKALPEPATGQDLH
jgi:uncharacterized membrane protein